MHYCMKRTEKCSKLKNVNTFPIELYIWVKNHHKYPVPEVETKKTDCEMLHE